MTDDESYFTYSGSEMPRNAGFYAGPGGDVAENIKFKPKAKFQKRVMVWLAISPRGISKTDFSESHGKSRREILQGEDHQVRTATVPER